MRDNSFADVYWLMRLAVVADIHGNSLALEAVRNDLARRAVAAVVNLGDCVSGPLWPRATIEVLMQTGWPTVRGNHDRWVCEPALPDHGSSDAFAFRELDSHQRDWLADLPPVLDLGSGIIAIHGRPDDDNAYLLEDIEAGRLVRAGPGTVAARLAGVAAPVVLCAHSHLPGLLRLPDGRSIINPGSVGCPAYQDPTAPAHVSESGSPHARYAVIELDDGRLGVEHIALAYDHLAAARRAQQHGRPDWRCGLATGFVQCP